MKKEKEKKSSERKFDLKEYIADRPAIVVIAILGIVTLLSIIFSSEIYGPNSVFNKSISDNVTVDQVYQYIPRVITCLKIIFLDRSVKFKEYYTLSGKLLHDEAFSSEESAGSLLLEEY